MERVVPTYLSVGAFRDIYAASPSQVCSAQRKVRSFSTVARTGIQILIRSSHAHQGINATASRRIGRQYSSDRAGRQEDSNCVA